VHSRYSRHGKLKFAEWITASQTAAQELALHKYSVDTHLIIQHTRASEPIYLLNGGSKYERIQMVALFHAVFFCSTLDPALFSLLIRSEDKYSFRLVQVMFKPTDLSSHLLDGFALPHRREP
jgi:hypothetical protein